MKNKIFRVCLLASLMWLSAGSVYAATSSNQPKVSGSLDLIKTTKSFADFKVTLETAPDVNVENLLNAIPKDTASTSNEELLGKVADAINSVRERFYPDKTVNLELVNQRKQTRSVVGYVNATVVRYAWNQYVPYNGTIYNYNYYDNTAVCFARIKNGTWYGQYQSGGSWYGQKYMYSGNVYTSYATGYDTYKGCHYRGLSSYNLADIVIYIFD